MTQAVPNFDTAAAIVALESQGFKHNDAAAIVNTVKASQEHLASKSDIDMLLQQITNRGLIGLTTLGGVIITAILKTM